MKFRSGVQVVASIVVAVFAIGIWTTGGDVEWGWLRFFSLAVLMATIALNLWERWLWGLRISQRLSRVPRDIRGTWKGTLSSLWVHPDSGATPDRKTAFLVVRQTATTVSVRLFTDELRSRSTLAEVRAEDGQSRLDYLYVGEPDVSVEHQSRMHRGSASLDVTGSPSSRLTGRYWTDRNSRGALDFPQRHPKTSDDIDQAECLFDSAGLGHADRNENQPFAS